MNLSKRFSVCGAALVVAVVASPVQAQAPFSALWFDINDIGGTLSAPLAAGGGSVNTFTGSILFFTQPGPFPLATTAFGGDVRGNNTAVASFANTFFPAGSAGTLATVGGSMTFLLGTATGVSFSFSNLLGDSYSTTIVSGSGALVWDTISETYNVTVRTTGGSFAGFGVDKKFGDVDISAFVPGGAAHGLILDFFIPAGVTTATTIQAEVLVVIPLPQSVAMASVGLLGLGIRRRRL